MFESKSRWLAAARAVWEQSHQEYAGWPPADRETAHAAARALRVALRDCRDEPELQRRYWQMGDPLGAVLRAQLPPGFDDERLLTLEEACLWQRLRELGQGR